MDKAKRIYQELLQERSNIWYISDSYGSKIMIKIPSSILKAIIKGCKIELLFGIDKNIFHIGVNIYDDPVHFVTLTSTHKNIDEHLSVAKIMQLDKVEIQLYNELCACQCHGNLILTTKNKNDILCLLGNPKKLFTGCIDDKIHQSADNFQFSLGLDIPVKQESLNKIETLVIETKIQDLQTMENFFYEDTGVISTEISNADEGTLLEKEIFVALRSLFGVDIYLNPKIDNKKTKYRELIDILAFSDIGFFLIESKALGVINANEDRNMERKIKGLQKQIEKAIDQLIGAYKKIFENETIYDNSGTVVQFDRTLPPCGIILVSEILPFGDWEDIIKKLIITMADNGIMIHIMDLNELMQFIGHSKGSKYVFDNYLLQRAQNFVKNPAIVKQAKFSKL